MKRSIIAAMILVTSVAVAEARVEWRGPGKIVSLNKACRDAGWIKKWQGNLRFRPSDISDNGDRSGFSTILSYFAYGVRIDGRFDDTLRPVSAYGVSAGGYGPIPDAQFRFVSVKPANYKQSTRKIKVVAEFTDYGGDTGCTMQWKGTLKRQ